MISHDQLDRGHSLSLTVQPEIATLINSLRSERNKFTFLVGAGASIDAGLPDWRSLLNNIANQVPKGLDGLLRADPDELMRKAEHAIEMAMNHRGGSEQSVIQKALYENIASYTTGYEGPAIRPGEMTTHLVNLIASLPGRVSIITTNFDEVIETAFSRENIPYSQFTLDDIAGWEIALKDLNARIPIMHLHGIVPIQGNCHEPIVLTESHFLKLGPKARDVVSNALRNSRVVFLGVSLTDPNLIGPLWDSKDNDREAFALTVPTPPNNRNTISAARHYGLAKASYLCNKLNLHIIALKSYGQQNQLIEELGIATQAPEAYDSRDYSRSLKYGIRLQRTLKACYTALGGTIKSDFSLPLESLVEISKKLSTLLGRENCGSIRGFLDRSSKDPEVIKRFSDLSGAQGTLEGNEENFGLSFWLRETGGRSANEGYKINLIANTDLIPIKAPSFTSIPIEPYSSILEARILFYGVPRLMNFPRNSSKTSPWRSALCTPIRTYLDYQDKQGNTHKASVTIGAITLMSSRFANEPSHLSSDQEWHRTILAALSRHELSNLISLLEKEALGIIQQDPIVSSLLPEKS